MTINLKNGFGTALSALLEELVNLSDDEKIEAINYVKEQLHEISPFSNEPVDCVLWVKGNKIVANDYNPNKVAPPEMELLATSILADGYTQPIVTYPNNGVKEVIDGFHRNRVGKEVEEVKKRVMGYLPITIIRPSQEDRGDRIAATIRHNRARGKHQIQGMSAIVLELKRRNWSDKKIAKNLGMDPDEILRLTQILGLREMFKDKEFSFAWEAVDSTTELDIDEEELQT
jgi:ParB-like chromosome segregation protein Spo0J